MGRMADSDRQRVATLADLAAVIERAAADLALAEEPARFVAALEGDGGDPPVPATAAEPHAG